MAKQISINARLDKKPNMNIPLSRLNDQLRNSNSYFVLILGIMWVLLSWIVADQLLTLQIKKLVRDEKASLSKQLANNAEAIR